MATGKIISHIGGGEYNVEILYDTSTRDDRLVELTTWLINTDNTDKKAELQLELSDAEAALSVAQSKLVSEIATWNAINKDEDPEGYKAQRKVIVEVTGEGLQLQSDMIAAQLILRDLLNEFNIREVEKVEILRIGNEPNQLKSIWCVDLSDGATPREGYAVDELVNIWCLNYDPDKMLLPPKNMIVGGFLADEATYNIMRHLTKDVAPLSMYLNAALEVGFARWRPLFLEAIVVSLSTPNSRDCGSPSDSVDPSKEEITVEFESHHRSRGDGLLASDELITGTYDMIVKYYAGKQSFTAKDRVVCQIESIAEDGTPTGSVVGFVEKPQESINYFDSNCIANDTLQHNFSIGVTDFRKGHTLVGREYDQEGWFEYYSGGCGGFVVVGQQKYEKTFEKLAPIIVEEDNTGNGVPAIVGGCNQGIILHPGSVFHERHWHETPPPGFTQYYTYIENTDYVQYGDILIPGNFLKETYTTTKDDPSAFKKTFHRRIVGAYAWVCMGTGGYARSIIEQKVIDHSSSDHEIWDTTYDLIVDCAGVETKNNLVETYTHDTTTIPITTRFNFSVDDTPPSPCTTFIGTYIHPNIGTDLERAVLHFSNKSIGSPLSNQSANQKLFTGSSSC